MAHQTSFKVLIDDNPHTLSLVYHAYGSNSYQYNTEQNISAHTFNFQLHNYPKNTKIITNGHTYIIVG